MALLGLWACQNRTEQRELGGVYVTRDGLASFEFRPGRQYRFRHRLLDISIEGEYRMADARRIYLSLPLPRAEQALGSPLLLRHRDELRLEQKDGQVVRFFRRRDATDGPEPLPAEPGFQDPAASAGEAAPEEAENAAEPAF